MKKINQIFFSLLFLPFFVSAASFNIDTDIDDSVSIGEDMIFNVSIDNEDFSVTAFEGRINFDSEKVELLEINHNSSVVDYWIIEPVVEDDGVILFNGALEEDGYLFSIKFKAIDSGVFLINIPDGNVIIKQEDIYNLENISSNELIINISEEEQKESFKINSPTHPDEDKWYSENVVVYEWFLPKGVEAVKLLIDENEFSWPSVEYVPPIESKEIELDDGIWYFHLRYKDSSGWSDVQTRKVMIDSQKPDDFSFDFNNNETLSFVSYDNGSGIQGYEIYIPSENYTFFTNVETSKFPFLKPGEYSIIVKAIDKAGNYVESVSNLMVPFLESPTITRFYLYNNERLIIKGESYARTKNIISIEGEKTYNGLAKVGKDGVFVFEQNDLAPGNYKVYITVVGDDIMSQKELIGFITIFEEENYFGDTFMFKVLLTVLLMAGVIVVIYYFIRQEEDKPVIRKRGRPRKNKK